MTRATRFNWIGSPNAETALLIVWHATSFATINDVKQRELTIGSSSANATTTFWARVLAATLTLKLKIVLGYPGSADAFLAMERGEIQGYPSAFWSSLRSTTPEWIADKKIRLLLQYGPQKNSDLANVPFAEDLVDNAEDKAVLNAAMAPLAFGRPFMVPPNVPVERVALLRRAMDAVYKDPEFLAAAAKQQLEIAPVPGVQLQDILKRVYASSPTVITKLRRLAGTPDDK